MIKLIMICVELLITIPALILTYLRVQIFDMMIEINPSHYSKVTGRTASIWNTSWSRRLLLHNIQLAVSVHFGVTPTLRGITNLRHITFLVMHPWMTTQYLDNLVNQL